MKALLRGSILLLGAGVLIWMAIHAGLDHQKCRQCDKGWEDQAHTAMKDR